MGVPFLLLLPPLLLTALYDAGLSLCFYGQNKDPPPCHQELHLDLWICSPPPSFLPFRSLTRRFFPTFLCGARLAFLTTGLKALPLYFSPLPPKLSLLFVCIPLPYSALVQAIQRIDLLSLVVQCVSLSQSSVSR